MLALRWYPMNSLLLALSVTLFSMLFLGVDALACSSSCSGCNPHNINIYKKKHPSWKLFYEKVIAEGVKPISCFRSRACQEQLLKCYNRRRDYGRVAKRASNHETRIAMDFSTRNGHHIRAREIAKTTLTGNVRQLMHGGGGFHMSNGASEGSRLAVRGSRAVDSYRAKRKAKGVGNRNGYIVIPGKSGTYLKRGNEFIRMTWEPIRS